jgi:hypothetical protein
VVHHPGAELIDDGRQGLPIEALLIGVEVEAHVQIGAAAAAHRRGAVAARGQLNDEVAVGGEAEPDVLGVNIDGAQRRGRGHRPQEIADERPRILGEGGVEHDPQRRGEHRR